MINSQTTADDPSVVNFSKCNSCIRNVLVDRINYCSEHREEFMSNEGCGFWFPSRKNISTAVLCANHPPIYPWGESTDD